MTQEKTQLQKPCQRDKYLGCQPCKILGTILQVKQMDQRTRKLMTVHKALHPRDDVDRQYVPRREKGRGLASIEGSVDTSIQRLEVYIEKCGETLITATRNNTNDTRTRKQKLRRKTTLWTF